MAVSTQEYARLLKVPYAISREIDRFEKNRSAIKKDYENEKKNIQEAYDSSEATSSQVRERLGNEADARYQNWMQKLDQYKKKTESTRQQFNEILTQAVGTPVQSAGQAIGMLEEETQQRLYRRKGDDNRVIIDICRWENQAEAGIAETNRNLGQETLEQRKREIDIAERRFSMEHSAHESIRDQELRRSDRKYTIRMEQEEEAFVERIENLIAPDTVKSGYDEMKRLCPSYEVFEPAEEFPTGIQFGYAGYDITDHAEDELKSAVFSRRFGYSVKEANGRKYMVMPYGFSFKDARFSTMFTFNKSNREMAAESIRNLALNLYMSIPVNKCWCTFIDPVSLGNTFAVFSPMGDKDEKGNGDERAIDIRIWSEEKQIEERLKLIVDHTTDVIQRCLQGRYENILDYNEDAGINAEPLRFLMVMDFPRGFSDRSISYLESIIDNGPMTGVYTIIAADEEEMNRRSGDLGRIRTRIQNSIETNGNILCVRESTLEGPMRFFPFEAPTSGQYVEIITEIRKHLGEEIVITYPMISGNLPEKPDYWFHKSAIDGISVPVGMEGAGKIVNLEFGHPYHSFAAMLGGTTGSGKSSLMHTIIQSIIFNYSPEDVQMYLLDFKQGVEFKCYADYKLPNFRVVSVETEPEFGLAVLNELHKEMGRRSAKFRSIGVGTIEGYWRHKGERGESHADMPRILVIFDEVQALLHDTENEISKRCVSLIQELVTQGARAFGMHLILSTQTFENVKGLDSGVYSNVHTRIALKSTKASAELLLNNDNEIANRLTGMDPGQGVININAGDRDANRTFRAAFITDDERDLWMQQVRDKQMEIMAEEMPKPRILLAGPEDDSENPLTEFAASGMRPFNIGDPSYHLYIGESLTMVNTFLPTLWNRRGQNLLLVGKDSEGGGRSRQAMGYTALSLLLETIRINGEITSPFITVFDLSGNSLYGTNDYDMLEMIEEQVPEAFRIVPPTMILDGIETLYSELGGGHQQFVLFYGLNRAKQLTTGTYQRSPKEQLEELFAKGPELGMNFVVWANDPGLFVENYGAAMSSFDLRLAYGMDDKEYKAITGENGPKTSSDMNAISYNLVGDNQKIRLYARPTENWLYQLLMNIRKYVRS